MRSDAMKIEQRTFRIGELAHHLDLQQFVIRFWEKEFNFKSHRSQGGQRYYTESDLQRFERIKELLYEQGLTIAGAKKHLGQQESKFISSPATTIAVNETPLETIPEEKTALQAESCKNETLVQQLKELREKAQRIHSML